LDLVPQPPARDVSAAPLPAIGAASADTAPHAAGSRPVWILVGGGAATAIAAGFGTYFLLHGASLADDGDKLRAQVTRETPPALVGTNTECYPTTPMRSSACDGLPQNGEDRATARKDATVAWIAAGALGVATVATYFLWPTNGEAHGEHARVSIAPWLVGARGGAVRVDF